MIGAISIGAAVTSHTRWPWSRCSCASARVPGPDPVRHRLVEDLLADLLELLDGVPGDEAEGGVAGLGDVLGVLDADDAEVGLLPGGPEDVAGGEEVATVQPAGEVEDARALHHGVVDVEERGRGQVGRHVERGLDLGGRGRGLTGQRGALLEVQAAGASSCGVTSVRVDPQARPHAATRVEVSAHAPDGPRRPRAPCAAGGTGSSGRRRVGRSSVHLARARGRGRVGRHRSRRARDRGRAPGDARDRQPDRVRHDLPRRAAGPGRRRTGQPALDRRRARPDDRRLRHPAGRRRPAALDTVRAAVRPGGGRPRRRGRPTSRPTSSAAPSAHGSWPSTLLPRRASWRTPTCSPPRPATCRLLPDPEKLAALLYTSGTSGRPRAAMLTHRALLANIDAGRRRSSRR